MRLRQLGCVRVAPERRSSAIHDNETFPTEREQLTGKSPLPPTIPDLGFSPGPAVTGQYDGPVPGEPDVDLLLASLSADGRDLSTYFEILAQKLADSLGPRVAVDRFGGFRRRGRASRLALTVGDAEFTCSLEKTGFACAVKHVVRGITLRTDTPYFPDWLRELVTALAGEADRSAATRQALETLLI